MKTPKNIRRFSVYTVGSLFDQLECIIRVGFRGVIIALKTINEVRKRLIICTLGDYPRDILLID